MKTYFFSLFLNPATLNKLEQIPAAIEDVQKYLYISTLSRILSSLALEEQQEFIATLHTSEHAASEWIATHPATLQLVKEHLERTTLTFLP